MYGIWSSVGKSPVVIHARGMGVGQYTSVQGTPAFFFALRRLAAESFAKYYQGILSTCVLVGVPHRVLSNHLEP